MYVDESGDPGISQYSSKHYILTGIIIHQSEWTKFLSRLKILRAELKNKFGLNVRNEFHSAEIFRVNNNLAYKKIRKKDRIEMFKYYLSQIPIIFDTAKVINICLLKSSMPTTTNFQIAAWTRLLSRYDMYLKKSVKDVGIIISDETNDVILRNLLRKNRIYNPLKSKYGGTYNAPTDSIIEDISHRKSQYSYLIQTADVICHALYRMEYPKPSLKKYNVDIAFKLIDPVLLKEASPADPMGIVRH